jgi:hypothetical protein
MNLIVERAFNISQEYQKESKLVIVLIKNSLKGKMGVQVKSYQQLRKGEKWGLP